MKAQYRIRRCKGNRACWYVAKLREDRSEIESWHSGSTSYSIDRLLAGLPQGAIVELINE